MSGKNRDLLGVVLVIFTFFSCPNIKSQASFGPEIEFRGLKQWPSILCAPMVYPEYRRKAQSFSSTYGMSAFAVTTITQAGLLLFTTNFQYSQVWALPLSILSGLTWSYGYVCPKIREMSERSYDAHIKNALIKHCEKHGCQFKEISQKPFGERSAYTNWEIEFLNGKKIQFTHDTTVIEVKTGKIYLRELEDNADFYEEHIFKLLKTIGLKPSKGHALINHGEFHLGILESFINLEVLRNYLVDQYNHWELAAGILGEDPIEGKPFQKNPEADAVFKNVISKLDKLILAGQTEINNEVFDILKALGRGNIFKNFMISYNHEFKTLEHRYTRSYKNTADMILRFKLIELRIRYLEGVSYKELNLNPYRPLTSNEKLKAYENFVKESGGSFEEFNKLLRGKYWFLNRTKEVFSVCQNYLLGETL